MLRWDKLSKCFFKQRKLMSTVGKSFCTHLFAGFLVINTDVLIVMIDIEM